MLKGFVTNLGKYNEGILQGEWVTFPISEDELEEVFERIGINEIYEEFFFSDWECEFEHGLGEYENIDSVNELAENLEEIETYGEEDKLHAIIEATGYSLWEAIRYIDAADFFPGYTMEEVAEEYVNEWFVTPNTPDIFVRYFDYEAFARDIRFDGYTETDYGVICI